LTVVNINCEDSTPAAGIRPEQPESAGRNLAVEIRPQGSISGPELEAAHEYALQEKAAATRKAYATDWAIFDDWCNARHLEPLPAAPETVAAFLASQADQGIKPSTLQRRTAAIRYAHKLAGQTTPTDNEAIRAVLRGIRRTHGAAPDKKAPALSEIVITMVSHCPDNLAGRRDRALILMMFAGAFRVSELVALNFEDLQETESGLKVRIRRSKTDQEGLGQEIAIVPGRHACPIKALNTWREASGVETGPIFRRIRKNGLTEGRISTKGAALLIKKYALLSGLDATRYSPHSLRSGLATSAAERGANIWKIMELTRHKSVETLRGYVRSVEKFKNHAAEGLL